MTRRWQGRRLVLARVATDRNGAPGQAVVPAIFGLSRGFRECTNYGLNHWSFEQAMFHVKHFVSDIIS
ncbi:hypothetical protein [Reticulibacter mediterranei]|uniref:hypothetical protein n=1 Tax=Reticulibacter mediterranei TaxID=2778369 RepID=UPI001C693611|nr:hypothetical protein [Reticulibacter mediterranei]